MYERSAISQLAILSVLSILLAFHSPKAFAQQSESSTGGTEYHISALKSNFENDTLSIELVGNSVPAYTVSERFAPFRAIIDIAGAVIDQSVPQSPTLIPANPVGKMSVYKLPDQQQVITRFEIEIADTHDYKVARDGNNIDISIAPASHAVDSPQTLSTAPAITDFDVTTKPGETSILLVGTGEKTDYKVQTLAADKTRPARMYIDIPDVSITELVRAKKIGTSVEGIRVQQHGTGARIVFDSSSSELFDYDVRSTEQGISVLVNEHIRSLPSNLKTVAATKPDTATNSTLDELIESSSGILSKKQKQASEQQPATDAASAMQDNFAFSGYNKQRISVDFYKIDIHNVFRLFRQITNLNIIVDQDVQGTVTLALSDVPWDFALDIILNLQNLAKEERYNTIVIYPKKKEFVWPEHAEDNLSFEADAQVVEQESLIIEESANLPEEVMQAKDILRQASIAEKNQDFEDAAALYEKAAALWPTNSSIYNRLASIYLVNLGVNAKVVFYAKESLKVDPKNERAALYAAIASANMQRTSEASEYFTQAISGNPPMKEALFSFASFSETNNQFSAALKLLEKYSQYHGDTIDTMLAKARILDKMGNTQKATEQYQALMSSGFQLSPDLKTYVSGRLGAGIK